ncbi:MAG: class I SAM-dependent methyltransferase [Usitatibacteraceae bacterium]
MSDHAIAIQCPICASNITRANSARTYIAPFNSKEYTVHRCTQCDLGFWTPLQIDPAFYEDEGFAAYADYHQGERPFPPWCLPFFEKLPISQGRLLDVGCGDGAFLARARTAGFETWGMDLDKSSVQAAITNFGLERISQATLENFVLQCRSDVTSFDVITFFEVLEHQDRPSDFIDQILSILKPGGYVAGSVPNDRRLLAGLDRKISPGDLPPHHFLWFSRKTLQSLFSGKEFGSVLIHPSGNIPFAELREKFAALLYSKLAKTHEPSLLLRAAGLPVVWVSAVALNLLYRFAPAHLYFQAVKPNLPDVGAPAAMRHLQESTA